MKVVILAGGRGTRLSEYTHSIPKPMVEIGHRPMLWHIMSIYARAGFKDFVLALGYKGELIKDYFLNHRTLSANLKVDLKTGAVETFPCDQEVDWKVTLIDTGLDTLTGGRVARLKNILKDEPFMLTYGDGVADIDIQKLMAFHRQHGRMVTMTAVHPVARFGEVTFDTQGLVQSFQEKPQTTAGWINGGFFVVEPKFLELLGDDTSVLEREPLEKAAAQGELAAYPHNGFWQCMDTVRDRDLLDELCLRGEAPWLRK